MGRSNNWANKAIGQLEWLDRSTGFHLLKWIADEAPTKWFANQLLGTNSLETYIHNAFCYYDYDFKIYGIFMTTNVILSKC